MAGRLLRFFLSIAVLFFVVAPFSAAQPTVPEWLAHETVPLAVVRATIQNIATLAPGQLVVWDNTQQRFVCAAQSSNGGADKSLTSLEDLVKSPVPDIFESHRNFFDFILHVVMHRLVKDWDLDQCAQFLGQLSTGLTRLKESYLNSKKRTFRMPWTKQAEPDPNVLKTVAALTTAFNTAHDLRAVCNTRLADHRNDLALASAPTDAPVTVVSAASSRSAPGPGPLVPAPQPQVTVTLSSAAPLGAQHAAKQSFAQPLRLASSRATHPASAPHPHPAAQRSETPCPCPCPCPPWLFGFSFMLLRLRDGRGSP